MTRRWTGRLSVCLIAAMALVGCSDKQEASESLPSVSSSATPTEEELPPLGPEDMPMPDEARTQDAAGAEAFVRYYFDLLNQSLTTMNPEFLRLFSEETCEVCERIASETEADASQGYTYSGGELTILGSMTVRVTGSEAETAFFADQAPMSVLDEAGSPVPELVFDGEIGLSSGSTMNWDDSTQSWTMVGLTLG